MTLDAGIFRGSEHEDSSSESLWSQASQQHPINSYIPLLHSDTFLSLSRLQVSWEELHDNNVKQNVQQRSASGGVQEWVYMGILAWRPCKL